MMMFRMTVATMVVTMVAGWWRQCFWYDFALLGDKGDKVPSACSCLRISYTFPLFPILLARPCRSIFLGNVSPSSVHLHHHFQVWHAVISYLKGHTNFPTDPSASNLDFSTFDHLTQIPPPLGSLNNWPKV